MTIPQALFELNDKTEGKFTLAQHREKTAKKEQTMLDVVVKRYKLNLDQLLNLPISHLTKMVMACNADLRKFDPPDGNLLDAARKRYAGVK